MSPHTQRELEDGCLRLADLLDGRLPPDVGYALLLSDPATEGVSAFVSRNAGGHMVAILAELAERVRQQAPAPGITTVPTAARQLEDAARYVLAQIETKVAFTAGGAEAGHPQVPDQGVAVVDTAQLRRWATALSAALLAGAAPAPPPAGIMSAAAGDRAVADAVLRVAQELHRAAATAAGDPRITDATIVHLTMRQLRAWAAALAPVLEPATPAPPALALPDVHVSTLLASAFSVLHGEANHRRAVHQVGAALIAARAGADAVIAAAARVLAGDSAENGEAKALARLVVGRL